LTIAAPRHPAMEIFLGRVNLGMNAGAIVACGEERP
jgi:hypothetical protein